MPQEAGWVGTAETFWRRPWGCPKAVLVGGALQRLLKNGPTEASTVATTDVLGRVEPRIPSHPLCPAQPCLPHFLALEEPQG